jgi:hypothetical protein
MLRFISETAAGRGLEFQLGIWTHGYDWSRNPGVNYTIEGLTPETNALYCRDAKLAAMPCRGSQGCVRRASDAVDCDNGVAELGDGCDQPHDTACSADKKAELVCKDGKFVFAGSCKGPHGCIARDESVECDNDVADEDDLCVDEGDAACRADRAAFLKCTGGRFKATNSCRGPRGCVLSEKPEEQKTLFECDDSLAKAGDPCEDEGDDACSMDKKDLYACHAHKFVVSKSCRGGKACGLDTATGKFDCRPGM